MSKTKVQAARPIAKPAPKVIASAAPISKSITPGWQYLLIFLLPLSLHFRSIGFDFSYHDDDKMIVEKKDILSQGIDFQRAFTTDAWLMKKGIELYRPFQTLTYMLDFKIGGGSAGVFHAHNALVFALGGLLFFLFLQRLFPQGATAFWGGLLFPLNFLFVHTVNWIPARGDLWLFVFSMLCLLSCVDFLKKRDPRLLWLNALCFFLALLSKESAVALLPVQGIIFLTLADAPDFRKNGLKTSLIFWLALTLVGLAVYFMLRKNAIAISSETMSAAAVFTNLRTIPEEVAKFFLPFGFSVMPDFSMAWTLAGLAILAALGTFIFSKKATLRPEILWIGTALWLLPYLPSLAYNPHFATFGYDYLDHRAFLVLTGFWLILLELAERSGFFEKKSATAVCLGIASYFLVFNVLQSSAYQNWQAYYENATRTNPSSALAWSNLGTMTAHTGKLDEAQRMFEKAKKSNPEDTDTRIRLAEMLIKQNRHAEAIVEVEFALSKNPQLLRARQFRGVANGQLGKNELAIADFEAASKMTPNDPENWRNLGYCYKNLSRFAEAIPLLTKAIELKPDFADALNDRAFCYGNLGKFAEAKADLDKVVQLTPQNGSAWFFRGRANGSLGNREAACADFQKAKSLNIKEAEDFLKNVCQQ